MKNIKKFVDHLVNTIHPISIICYGSYAQNLQDTKSDIDLLVLVDKDVPSKSIRENTYTKYPNTTIEILGKDMGDWDSSWSPANDCIVIDNQKIDIGYNTTTWVNKVIENLIIKNKITFDEFLFRPYTFFGLLETSKVLYDKDNYIASCLSKIRPIPLKLKNEIINSVLPALKESYEELLDYSERDIGILAYQFHLFRGLDAMVTLLFTINDTYDPASKRTEHFLFKLKKLPQGLPEFINVTLPSFYTKKTEVVNFLRTCINFVENEFNIGQNST